MTPQKTPKTDVKSIIWTVLAIGLSIFLIVYFGKHSARIESFIEKFGVLGPLASVFLYGLLSVTPIPTDSLTILNGALFGPVVGVLTSWMGNNVAAVIEYYLGRGIGSVTDFEDTRRKLPFGLGKMPVDSAWFLIIGRLVPGYGSKVVSLVGGMYNVSLWRYVWTAAFSNMLGAIMFSLGGYGLLKTL